jgi:hypothetical protein
MSETESAPAAEGEAAEAAEGAEEAVEEEKQPTPPIEMNLPPEVAEGLTNVLKALEEFGKTVKPFLEESHANAADAANAADPLIMPEGLPKIEEVIGEWGKKVDGQIEPLKIYIARIEKERVPIDEYLAALKEVFKDAAPIPTPEAEAAS